MSRTASQSARDFLVRCWPLIASLVATLGFIGITVALLLDLRASIDTRARDNTTNLLKALERDIARNIEVLDLSLQAVVEGMGRADVLAADPVHRNLILFDHSTRASGLGAMLVYDAAGQVLFDSEGPPRKIAPATDREYFQAQQAADRGLFISAPYLSRVTHTTVIGLSRRISNPEGGFAGVALGSIETSYFSKLFGKLELGQKAAVSLVREDGSVLVRMLNGESVFGSGSVAGTPLFERVRAEQSGTLFGQSPLDGEERLYAFTRVGEWPLYLSVGLSQAGIFQEWREKASLLLTLALVISTMLVALTIRLTGELRRRSLAERTLERLNAELAVLSVTDSLTGLGNRRAFDAAIAREIRGMRRTGRPLGLVTLDVDYFKLFNDRYGHGAGDRVLRLVAGAMAEAAGPDGEGAFRVGGEEFAMLLPGRDLAGSVEAAERLRKGLHAAAVPHEASPLGLVTASLGVTTIGAETAASALARADQLLYAAKRAGRDRATAESPLDLAEARKDRWSGMNIVTIGRRSSRRQNAA